MLPLTVSRCSGQPLAVQIVEAIRGRIDARQLRPGARLPSIRGLAASLEVSRFTIVEAYDRLVALGYLQARRGDGFYAVAAAGPPSERAEAPRRNEQLIWLIRRLLEADDTALLAGGPWLPASWLDEAGIRRSLNVLARRNGAHLLEYDNPFGYLPLREHLALMLGTIGLSVSAGQILLTQGVSQALELLIRHLLRPGDAALVDDPGYYNMFGNLRLHGVELLAVPRLPEGPDVDALERLAAAHRPRVYFTQSMMQNPTGAGMSPHVGFRVLQAAARHDFTIIEDDIFCDLQPQPAPRLATLDQLARVIYVRSFSKTLSGSLRTGFLAGPAPLVAELAEFKMLSCITSSQLTERLTYLVLADGHYRKYLARLHERLAAARLAAMRGLEQVGMELFVEPGDGMFLWARFPEVPDALALAGQAGRAGILLAPGTVFRPHLGPSPWMRFNVAVCEEPRVPAALRRLADDAAG